MYKPEIDGKFNLNLSAIRHDGKTEKELILFFRASGTFYACECNFCGSSDSNLNETARKYKTITEEAKNISGFEFVWFTDGIGWNSAIHNLEETFDVLDCLYNLNDLENGAIKK